MYNHDTIVKQHPSGFCNPFRGCGKDAVLVLEFDADMFCQRPQVAVAGAGRYDEKVGNYTIWAEVENEDVLGFFVFQQFCDLSREFEGVQSSYPFIDAFPTILAL